VKAVKRIFYALVRDRSFDKESLHTFMIEIEWTLNIRLLTPVSEDPDDQWCV